MQNIGGLQYQSLTKVLPWFHFTHPFHTQGDTASQTPPQPHNATRKKNSTWRTVDLTTLSKNTASFNTTISELHFTCNEQNDFLFVPNNVHVDIIIYNYVHMSVSMHVIVPAYKLLYIIYTCM